MAIDNNLAERTLRPAAIGHKNWLFVGNDQGGRTAAALFTMVASAKACGVDPFAWKEEKERRKGVRNQITAFWDGHAGVWSIPAPGGPPLVRSTRRRRTGCRARRYAAGLPATRSPCCVHQEK
ncbi:MAG: transposase [Pirellulales bacterium]|nr:transposase [Pirellulales bacterium]